MFGIRESRRHKAERIAGQAWDQLASTLDSAGSTARSARKRAESVYGDASQKVTAGSKEARRRATDAYDALLGRRKRGTSWGWVATAAAAGLAVGWVATLVSKKALEAPSPLSLESITDDVYSGVR
jgi:hypothetical protein